MLFYSRPNGKFYIQLVFSLLAVFCSIVIFSKKAMILDYSLLVLWIPISCLIWLQFGRLLLIILNRKPILIINEQYVFDRISGLEYSWTDISEIVDDGGILDIILAEPSIYLNKIKNPLRKAYFKMRFNLMQSNPFRIQVNLIDVNKKALLELLNNYSV